MNKSPKGIEVNKSPESPDSKSPGAESTSATGVFVPPPPPKTPKSASTRRLLLELAARLFIERGYASVGMRDIASAAELSKGAVYGHFRSKGQLLVEVIRWKSSMADQSVDFAEARAHPERGVELMYNETRRDIRLLEVDAAAAARHDSEVAAGLRSFYFERQARTRDAATELDDPDTAAWVIGAIDAGIGVREASGLDPPEAHRLNAILLAAVTSLPNRKAR